eukprot:TRINITY_DN18_c0_g1_i1.p1 TRINITY_DN18_c0_g1~~TRINITY_DN18_c0_g1_i1.p1  ORF type:complete len:393 (-),score=120.54 TRINITY_DN18_c0_g1_i1:36-1214(-)
MKEDIEEEKPLLGIKVRGHLSAGLVGLPNVGKSTLFNILTKMNVPAENFPFCTIDPTTSRVNVPDKRFDWLCEKYKPRSEVQAFLEITDIAGLVKGAHNGDGLGNAFLSHIKQVDGIFQIIRIFEDQHVTHVEGDVDPVRDLDIISTELRLKDLQILESQLPKLEQVAQRVDKSKAKDVVVMKECIEWLKLGKDIRDGDWKIADIPIINSFQLLTAKPIIYLINMSKEDYARQKNKWLVKVKKWVDDHGSAPMVPFSAALEQEIVELGPKEQQEFLDKIKPGLKSAIPKILTVGYKALQLINFFTCGEDEVRAWTITRGTRCPQAAGTIHTDFEKAFIAAEVMSYDDLKELGTEGNVRSAGKYRREGKNYIVKDGDICLFKVGQVNKGNKKK